MSANSFADGFAQQIADITRRLRAVERSAQLDHSSVIDEDGNPVNVAAGVLAGAQASTDAAVALSQLVTLQGIADGKVTVFYADTAPSEAVNNPEYDDQWLVTAADGATYNGTLYAKGSLLRYDGDTWVLLQDAATAAAALAAAQNAQDTADGKIVTYWSMSDPAPGIPGGPSNGDLWYQVDPEPQSDAIIGVLRWDTNVQGWRPLPLAANAIAAGGVAPDRMSIGVVSNLVQDPQFRGSLWTPPLRTVAPFGVSDWSVAGPDTVYPDNNYLRSRNRTPGAAGDVNAEATWRITPRIPVDPGRSVRLAVQVRCDPTAATGSLSGGTAINTVARLRVYLYRTGDPDTGPWLSGPDQYIAMTLVDAMAGTYDTWVDLAATFVVPDGYTSFSAAVQTVYQTAGAIDFIRPEVQVLWSRVQSADYEEGSAGWALDTTTVQMPNVNVLSTLGADVVSANRYMIRGRDLETEYLTVLPNGVVAYDLSLTYTHSGTASALGTEYKIFEFAMGSYKAGRLYRIRWIGHLQATDPEDVFDLRIRITTDGSVPGVTSPLLRTERVMMGATVSSTAFHVEKIFSAGNDVANGRFALTLIHAGGPGGGFIYNTAIDRATYCYVEDLGLYAGAADAGTLSQKSIGAGGQITAPQPDPVNAYTTTWTAAWSRSYDESGATREGDDTPDLYQGYSTSVHGNTRSLFGFNYADIQARLAGATIKSVTLTYRVKHSYSSLGFRIYISSHNYTARPATWAAGNVTQNRLNAGTQKEGVTYTQSLPVAVGNEFKAGTTRGLGFGPGLNTSTRSYYGYMYGADSPSSAPRLTVAYTK